MGLNFLTQTNKMHTKQSVLKVIEVDNAVSVDVSFSSSSVTVKGVDPREGIEFSFNVSNYNTDFLTSVMSNWDLKKLIESWRSKDRDQFDSYIEKIQDPDYEDKI